MELPSNLYLNAHIPERIADLKRCTTAIPHVDEKIEYAQQLLCQCRAEWGAAIGTYLDLSRDAAGQGPSGHYYP